jgi:hypothetical protein
MVMLITLQRGDCTPREGARLSKIAHIRCAVDKGSRRTPLAPVQEHSATKGTRVFVSRFTAVNADRGKLLSYGYPAVRNFSPANHRAAFFELLVARENHTIFRASTFIACLTSTQVPRSARQFMHDMAVSLVGPSGMSNRPPHFPHLNVLSKVLLLEVPFAARPMKIAPFVE